MNIVFYGASVTQQNINQLGELTGYVPNAINYLSSNLSSTEFDRLKFFQLGYGSNHFNDAGFVCFNKVLACNPCLVVFDWHTTGLYFFNQAYFSQVIFSLLDIGCRVLFLFLPFKRHFGKQDAEHFKQARGFVHLYPSSCFLIDFYNIPADYNNLLRDEVHTNAEGGRFIGSIVGDSLKEIILTGVQRENYSINDYITPSRVSPHVFVSSHSEKLVLEKNKSLNIEFRVCENHNKVSLFANVIKGPFSPKLKVTLPEHLSLEVDTWDQWCSYQRKTLVKIAEFQTTPRNNSIVTIEIIGGNASVDQKLIVDQDLFLIGAEFRGVNIMGSPSVKKQKILIFANCHGAFYKTALEKHLLEEFDVEHVLSYENLENYEALEKKFQEADVLVIQPVAQYEKFKVENIKKVVNDKCLIIRVPFVRFEGFWPKGEDKTLSKFHKAAVMFFPELSSSQEIVSYLTEESTDPQSVLEYFEECLVKLKQIEATGDVEFFDFFLRNYKNIPLFRDSYHPTQPFYYVMAKGILDVMNRCKGIKFRDLRIPQVVGREVGHYKPIKNIYAKTLGLSFDLSSYFIVNRHRYLKAVLDHEVSHDTSFIHDLNQLIRILK